MRVLVLLSLCCCLPIAITNGSSPARQLRNKPARSEVEIHYSFQENPVSLREPVVLLFSVHNRLSQQITLKLGAENREFFEFSLTTPDGQVLQSRPFTEGRVTYLVFGSGRAEIPPGGDYEQPLLINQGFQFNAVGTYLLTVRLASDIDISGESTLAAQTQTVRLRVDRRDPVRLDKVCRDLSRRAKNATNVEQEKEPVLELSYIDDPIAVPYLADLLSHHILNYHLAVLGLERIGNEAAVEVLLTTMNDGYGDMSIIARQALTRMQDRIPNPGLREAVRRALVPKPSD